MLLAAVVAIAVAYQLLAIAACLRRLAEPRPARGFAPPISILKPVRGLDPAFYDAIRSHAQQDYPEFEILFGTADLADPSVEEIRKLQAEFPNTVIRLIHSTTEAPNGKVGVLIDLAREARHGVLLVNDSDIRVPAGYLRDVAAPLADERVGLVTCLYRAEADSFAGKIEALGISTDFAPSTLVAPLVGVNEFGLGSTLVFRRADLDAIGGFEAIQGYLADDYQLARCLTRDLHKRTVLSHVIVDTRLQAGSWESVWKHQLRWRRTIRVSRGDGYIGLPATFATAWACVALLCGQFTLAAAALGARLAMVVVSGVITMHCPIARKFFWCFPIVDLFGAGLWIVGLFGDTVQWRDRRLRLSRGGRIVSSAQTGS